MQATAWTDLATTQASIAVDAEGFGLSECPTASFFLEQPVREEVESTESFVWRLIVDAVFVGGEVSQVGELLPPPPSNYSFLNESTGTRREVQGCRMVGKASCPGAIGWRVTAVPQWRAANPNPAKFQNGRIGISVSELGSDGPILQHADLTRVAVQTGSGDGLYRLPLNVRLLGWTAVGGALGATVTSPTFCPIIGAGVSIPAGAIQSERFAPHLLIGRANPAGLLETQLQFTGVDSWAVEVGG